ncbi:unnamed protein product [Phytophthora lilii]|uniref:Unnamed protein product n=1 Tax=Phytophthora lilii TaxID=2077276 RepID=A0A9W6UC88_9STRA|nr:unnamed protein product [Phytophthora lilii]
MSKFTTFVLAMLATGNLAAADTNVTVHHDATYAIASSRGLVCSGHGGDPIGTACPLQGDVAITDCNPALPTYNGTDCIAPVDAECIMVESRWGCVFNLTSTLTVVHDESFEKSPWGDLPWRAPPPADQVSPTVSLQTDHVALK